MGKLMEFLDGKKSYLTGAAGIITVVLHLFGFISDDLAKTIYTGLGFTGVMTLRAGMKKAQ